MPVQIAAHCICGQPAEGSCPWTQTRADTNMTGRALQRHQLLQMQRTGGRCKPWCLCAWPWGLGQISRPLASWRPACPPSCTGSLAQLQTAAAAAARTSFLRRCAASAADSVCASVLGPTPHTAYEEAWGLGDIFGARLIWNKSTVLLLIPMQTMFNHKQSCS